MWTSERAPWSITRNENVKPPLGLRLLSQLRVWALGSLRVQDSAGIWRFNLASVQAAVVGAVNFV